MITQITKTAYFIIPLLFILGVYFYYTFKKFKEVDSKKLALLYAEIALEKRIALELQDAPKIIEKLEYSFHNKLQKIKVAVLDVNFSLKEILT
ncbi:MAG: hypothetical protein WAO74_01170 [Polaribacter sp.]|uniref:hypothetical protein n=1 Tax=Polaribacter sp. TaxID=1920175 RepID=UPI003BB10DA7